MFTVLIVLIAAMTVVCIRGFVSPAPEEVSSAATEPVILQVSTEPTAAVTVPTTVPETEPAERKFDTVPLYFQTDYPYLHYGDGTIGTSGCGITSLAMVATYLTEQEYRPDELAWHFGGYGENNIQRLEYGIEQLQLPCEKNYDWQVTRRALQEGKVAIIMVNERSEFTTSEHFMVLTGMTEEGRILVNDPFGPNYEEAYLEEGFRRGFTEGQIVCGLEGSWVFDKAAMPEEPFLYDAEKPEFPETRYEGVEPTDRDTYLLACFAWAIAREESQDVQQAVLEVVLNRLVSPGYPDTIEGVLRGEEFYRYYKELGKAEPDMPQYMAVTAALYGPHILPMEVLHCATWLQGGEQWGRLGSFVFLYTR